jgi:hypothetical protein
VELPHQEVSALLTAVAVVDPEPFPEAGWDLADEARGVYLAHEVVGAVGRGEVAVLVRLLAAHEGPARRAGHGLVPGRLVLGGVHRPAARRLHVDRSGAAIVLEPDEVADLAPRGQQRRGVVSPKALETAR